MNNTAVQLKGVGEKYTIYSYKLDSVKEKLLKGLSLGKGVRKELWALNDISLTIRKGEVVGVIGENGSGKTTLLRLIAGILKPDKGNIHINGSVAAILQLGVGFQRDLTGRENIYLNSAMLGIEPRIIDKCINDIISFAELEDFIDMPLKSYSSGMEMRLGFSIAVNVDPDVLLIDEVLIIGDEAFQKKCIQQIEEFKVRGKTIIIVSHSMGMIKQMCDRTFLLRRGNLICEGNTRDVINYYYQCSGRKEGITLLTDNDVELIFNNGRLFIFWKKQSITPDPGIYLSITESDNEFFSFHARWKVKKSTTTFFEAEGFIPSLSSTIVWKAYFGSDGIISFDISVIDRPTNAVVRLVSMLDGAYTSWFCNIKQGMFLEPHHTEERRIYSTTHKPGDFLGVDVVDGKDGIIPGMSFEVLGEESVVSLYRHSVSEAAHSIEFNFTKKEKCDFCIKTQVSLFTDTTKVEKTLIAIRESATIRNDLLAIFFDEYESAIRISYENNEVTCGEGLYGSVFYNNVWYNLALFRWELEKISSQKMKLVAHKDDVPIRQEWFFEIKGNALDVSITMQGDNDETLFQPQLVFFVDAAYKEWFCNTEKGECPDSFHLSSWGEIPLPPDRTVDFFALRPTQPGMPAVIFTDCKEGHDAQVYLYNVMHQGRGRAVSYVSNTFSSQATFHLRFDFTQREVIDETIRGIFALYILDLLVKLETHSVTAGPMRVLFDEKAMRIFYGGEEITGGIGLYSSLRHDNFWYDSTTGEWQYEKISPEKIQLTSTIKDTAIIQDWVLEVTDNTIDMQLAIRAPHNQQFSQPQLVLLTNKEYTEWFYNTGGGTCGDFSHKAPWEEIPLPNDVPLDFFALAAGREEIPALLLTDCSTRIDKKLFLYNTVQPSTARAINYIANTFTPHETFHLHFDFVRKEVIRDVVRAIIGLRILEIMHACASRSIVSGHLQVLFEDRTLRIFYDGEEMTSGNGLNGSFEYNKCAYNSQTLDWEYEKISAHTMKLTNTITDAAITQEWILTVKKNALELNARIDAPDAVTFSQPQFVCSMHKDYEQWFYDFERGICSGFNYQTPWEEITLPHDTALDFFAIAGEHHNKPALLLTDSNKNPQAKLSLYNTLHPEEARTISYRAHTYSSHEVFQLRFEFVEKAALKAIVQTRLQTSLESRSIVSGPLQVLCEGKNIRIIYAGEELTGGVGLYSSLHYNYIWHNSTAIVWYQEKVSSQSIKLTGSIKNTSIRQEWLLEVKNDALDVHVIINAPQDVTFFQPQLVLLTNKDYDEWLYNTERGDCPPFSRKTQWEEIPLPNDTALDFFAIEASTKQSPAIVVTDCMNNPYTKLSLHNTVEHGKVRAVSCISDKHVSEERFHVRFTFIPKEIMNDIVRAVRGLQIIKLLATIDAWSIASGSVQVFFNGQTVNVFYNGEAVTGDSGLFSSLQYKNILYNSSAGEWQTEKISSTKMKLCTTLRNTLIEQEWILEAHDNSLDVNVVVDAPEHQIFSGSQLVFLAREHYTEWFYNAECGICSDFSPKAQWEEIPLPNDTTLDFFALASRRSDMPVLRLTDCNKGLNTKLSLYSSVHRENTRAISYVSNAQGTHESFHVQFDFITRAALEDSVQSMVTSALESHTISSGALQVFFEERRVRVLYDGEEITRGVGFYSSLRCNNFLHNSSTSEWHREKISPREMKLVRSIRNTAIHEEWNFVLQDNGLEVTVAITAPDEITFSQPQLVLLASGDYREWLYNADRGICADFNKKKPWEKIPISNDARLDFFALTTKKKSIPGLLFTDCIENRDATLSLYNTIQQGNARALSYTKNTFSSHEVFHVRFDFVKKKMIDDLAQTLFIMQTVEALSELVGSIISSDRLHVFFEERSIKVFYDGREITGSAGLYSSLQYENAWHNSSTVTWRREKISPRKMKLTSCMLHNAITQEWLLEITDTSLDVSIAIYASRDMHFTQPQLVLLVNKEYTQWFYNIENGPCARFDAKTPWEEIPLPCDAVLDFFAVSSDQKNIPVLLFTDCEKSSYTKLTLHNSLQHGKTRAISYIANTYTSTQTFHVRFDFVKKAELTRRLQSMIEDRQQSCSIASGPLHVFFEEQSIKIIYNGKEVTTGAGFYNSLLCNNIWHNSSTYGWQRTKISPHTMKLTSTLKNTAITQEWLFEIDEHSLVIQGSIRASHNIQFSQPQLVFLIDNMYTDWFYNAEYGTCPTFNQTKPWEEIVAPNDDALDFCALATQGKNIPALLFTDCVQNKNAKTSFYNTTQQGHARAISYTQNTSSSHEVFHVRFDFTERKIIHELAQMLFMMQAIEVLHTLYSNTITSDRLKVFFDERSIKVLYDGEEITGSTGFYSSFKYDNVWYNSATVTLQREKISAQKMKLTNVMAHAAVTQEWIFEIKGNALDVTLSMDTDSDRSFFQPQLVLLAHQNYSEWFYNNEQGACTHFNEEVPWEEILLPSDTTLTFFAIASDEKSNPALMFTDCTKSVNTKLALYNSVQQGRARALSYISNMHASHMVFHVRYDFVEKGILTDTLQSRMAATLESHTILSGSLQVIFEDKHIRIRYNGTEVTRGVGLYSSLQYNNLIYNTSTSVWHREKLSQTQMKLTSSIKNIGIVQEWILEVRDDYLDVTATINAPRDVLFSQPQLVLLAEDTYDGWFYNIEHGVCPDFNYDLPWEEIPLPNDEAMTFFAMATQKKNRPAILFTPLEKASRSDKQLEKDDGSLVSSHTVEGSSSLTGFSDYVLQGNTVLTLYNTVQQGKARALSYTANTYSSHESFHVRFNFIQLAMLNEIKSMLFTVRMLSVLSELFSRMIASDQLQVLFDDRAIRVFFDGEEVTGSDGLYASLQYNTMWYNSSSVTWHRDKSSAQQMKLASTIQNTAIHLEWVFEVHDTTIDMKVNIEAPHHETFSQPQLVFLAHHEYDEWFYNVERGVCFDFHHDSLWEEIPLPHERSVTFFALASRTRNRPALLFTPVEKAGDEVVDKHFSEADDGFKPSSAHTVGRRRSLTGFTDYKKNSNVKVLLHNTTQQGRARAVSYVIDSYSSQASFHVRFELCRREQLDTLVRSLIESDLESRSIVSGPLRVLCEERRIRVLYDDCEITDSVGLYSSLQCNNIWYNSSTGKWQWEKISPQKMKLTNSAHANDINQEWTLEVHDHTLDVEVVIGATQEVTFSQPQIVLLAHNKYNQWFLNADHGTCSDFKPHVPFEEIPLPNDVPVDFFAVSDKSGEAPSLLFTDCNKNPYAKISLHNVNQQGNVRAVNYVLDTYSSHEAFHVRFDFVKKDIIHDIAHTLFILQTLDLMETLFANTISSGALQVLFEEQRMRIFYDGTEMTSGVGLYSSLYCDDVWYNSMGCKWQRKKISSHKMKLTSFLKNGSIMQEWLFEINDNALEVSGMIDAEEGISFSQPQFVLMAHKNYSDWLYNDDKGDCGEFNQRVPREEILLPNNKRLDFFAMTSKEKNMPALLFTDCEKNIRAKLFLYNTVQQGRARAINYLINTYSSHETFHVRFSFIKKPQLNAIVRSMIQTNRASRSIALGPLQIFFEEERINVLYKGKEVTEGAGFYTSLQCNNIWYNSLTMKWERKKLSPHTMQLTSMVRDTGINQKLVFEVSDKGLDISISITASPHAHVRFFQPQFVLLTKEYYKNWYFNREQGTCSDFDQSIPWEEIPLPSDATLDFFALAPQQSNVPAILCTPLEKAVDERAGKHLSASNGESKLSAKENSSLTGFTERKKNSQAKLSLYNTLQQGKARAVSYMVNTFSSQETFHVHFDFIETKQLQTLLQSMIASNRESRSITRGPCNVFFEDARIRIFYAGQEISAGVGLYSLLRSNNFWYNSSTTQWQCDKISSHQLKLTGNLKNTAITQEWILDVTDSGLEVNVSIHAPDTTIFSQPQLVLLAQGDYNEWFYNFNTGMCADFNQSIPWEEIPLPHDEMSSLFALSSQEKNLPPFVFVNYGINQQGKLSLHNTIQQVSARAITYILNSQSSHEVFHVCFQFVTHEMIHDIVYTLYALRIIEIMSSIEARSVSSGALRMLFDGKTIRAFYDGEEVTGEMGISSSLLSNTMWYDTLSFVWEWEKISSTTMNIRAQSKNGSIHQLWFCEVNNNALHMKLDVSNVVPISRAQMLFSVHENYHQWFYNEEEGEYGELIDNPLWEKVCVPQESQSQFFGLMHSESHAPHLFFSDTHPAPMGIHFRNDATVHHAVESIWEPSMTLPGKNNTYTFSFSVSFLDRNELQRVISERRETMHTQRATERDLRTIMNECVKVEFNKGEFDLYAGDRKLTKARGLNTSFSIDDGSNTIVTFNWTTQKLGHDILECIGTSKKYSMTQKWRLHLDNDTIAVAFCLLSNDREIEIKDFELGCTFNNFYTKWIIDIMQDVFTHVREGYTWEDIPLQLIDYPHLIGLRTDDNCPDIIFSEFPNDELIPIVRNSNNTLGWRSLNLCKESVTIRPGKDLSFSFCVTLFDTQKTDHCIEQERKKRTIEQGPLKLFFYDRHVQLFVHDRVVTAKHGIFSIAEIGNREFQSLKFPITYTKRSDNEMALVITYPFGQETLVWTLCDENRLTINATFSFTAEQRIDDYHFCFQFIEDYVSDYVLFDDDDERRLTPRGTIADKYNGNFYLVLNTKEKDLPPLALGGAFDTSDDIRVDITDEPDEQCKFIKIRKPIVNDKDSFVCNVIFGERQQYTFEHNQIAHDKLLFWVKRNGSGMLWNTKELTKAMGLYSSYHSNDNVWNDCIHHATRTCLKISDTELQLFIKWHQFPMEQWWHIQCLSNYTLVWKVKNKVLETFSFQKEQFNIMLLPAYKQWMLNDKKGFFPDTFNKDYGGDWQCCAETKHSADSVTMSASDTTGFLPTIKATCTFDNNDIVGKIINSDDTFGARVLQCFRGGPITMQPGEYDYMETRIELKERG